MKKWTASISGLRKCPRKDGGSIYEFMGTLNQPTNGLNFAFLVHPLNKHDVRFLMSNKKELKIIYNWIEKESKQWEKIQELTHRKDKKLDIRKKPGFIRSLYHGMGNRIVGDLCIQTNESIINGALVLVPFLPSEYIDGIVLKQQGDSSLCTLITESIINASNVAKTIGAQYIGLGAYNSIITQTSRGNKLDTKNILPVTSGNDLTAAGIPEGILLACKKEGINFSNSVVTIIGATGSVGKPTSKIIVTKKPKKIILAARKTGKLKIFKGEVEDRYSADKISITTNIDEAISKADIVIFTVSSTADELSLQPEWFKNVKIVCDASQPEVVTNKLKQSLPNVIFVKGAIFQIPGFITGFEFLRMGKSNQAYGCLSATIVRALIGKSISAGNGIKIDTKNALELLKQAKKFGIVPIDIRL